VTYALINAADEESFEAFSPAALAIIDGARLPLGVDQ